MKTLTKEEELRNAATSDQVPEEVVLKAIKTVSEEDLQKAKLKGT